MNGLFVGNSAYATSADRGGGAIFSDFYGAPSILNSTFVGNRTTNKGGAVFFSSSVPDGTATTIANSILWGNTATAGGNQIALANNCELSASHSDIQGGQPGILLGGVPVNWGAGNIDADPVFADADGPDGVLGNEDDDLHLLFGSPAIDAGDAAVLPADVADLDSDGDAAEVIPYDFDGEQRLAEGAVDIGVDEFVDTDGDGLADRVDTLSVTPDSQVMTYGGAVPTLTYTVAGLPNGQTLDTGATCIVADMVAPPVGTYPISLLRCCEGWHTRSRTAPPR